MPEWFPSQYDTKTQELIYKMVLFYRLLAKYVKFKSDYLELLLSVYAIHDDNYLHNGKSNVAKFDNL